MKYVLEWRIRPGVHGQEAEADTRRAYELYSKWQPRVRILQFVGRVDAEAGSWSAKRTTRPTSWRARRSSCRTSNTGATPWSTLRTGYRPVRRPSASATALAEPESKLPPSAGLGGSLHLPGRPPSTPDGHSPAQGFLHPLRSSSERHQCLLGDSLGWWFANLS